MHPDLLSEVTCAAGPLTHAQLLVGMQVAITTMSSPDQQRTVRGQVNRTSLYGVSLICSTGGQVHLSRTRQEPAWQITLEQDVHDRRVLPGACAAGVDVQGFWQGLWLATGDGQWEAVRPDPGIGLMVDEDSLEPVQLQQAPITAELLPGELALVELDAHIVRGIRWEGSWRIPALSYTASCVTPLFRLIHT